MDSKFIEKYGTWAIITGASSGIGEEFAKQLAAKGMNVVLIARRKERLQILAKALIKEFNIEAKFLECDLSLDGFHHDILDFVKNLDIGLLINNAGMNCEGHFYRGNLARNTQMMQLNMKAPYILTYELGKHFITKGKGGVIFTASTSSFNANPYLSHYGATKAYILSLAESLNYEWKPKNIDVLAVCPGPTETEMTAGVKENPMVMKVAPVVKAALDSLGKETYVVPGIGNKIHIFLNTKILNRTTARNLSANILARFLPGVKERK